MNSRLWFVNNPKLEERILAYLARYQEMYNVEIYAFVLMGNHYHLVARFPECNKAAFFKSFNAIIAKLTACHVKSFEGGRLWARRVRIQAIPRDEDIENQFFYSALNPIAAGLCQTLREYRSYNSFSDAIHNRRREFKVVNWEKFNNHKRQRPFLNPRDCETVHTLVYSRLPGCEGLRKSEYIRTILERLEKRRGDVVRTRLAEGKGFASIESLRNQIPGAKPRSTKSSERRTHRPLVLTLCLKTKQVFLDWYFQMLHAFKLASKKFRSGDLNAEFPPGTYLPTRISKTPS